MRENFYLFVHVIQFFYQKRKINGKLDFTWEITGFARQNRWNDANLFPFKDRYGKFIPHKLDMLR